jgi:hypothetical protein
MKNTLYTKSQLIKMKKNYNKSALTGETDHKPVVKWFNPLEKVKAEIEEFYSRRAAL